MSKDKLQPRSEETKVRASEAMQRHHDLYVRLKLEGNLSEADKPSYELAMEREREGKVSPLAPSKEDYKKEFEYIKEEVEQFEKTKK
jgi:hypothetical protein